MRREGLIALPEEALAEREQILLNLEDVRRRKLPPVDQSAG